MSASLDDEDVRQARDAMIVAIGISSVLIINVAYVGYITTPGGSTPYWADCYYPLFVGYFVLNGFALVFSVAALCAVTWGPFVLMWCKQSTWRTRVVNMGLIHMAVSLASLLGAFACAGFVAASVGAPELTCGNIKCTDGGVPCNAFTIVTANESLFGEYVPWEPLTYKLDPVLAHLNNASFGAFKDSYALGLSPENADISGKDVLCHSYSYVATLQDLRRFNESACGPGCAYTEDWKTRDVELYDADDKIINKSCFVLADELMFRRRSDNPHTFWCSLHGLGIGPGWLPLHLDTAEDLLEIASPTYHRISKEGSFTKDRYAISLPKGQGASCPQVEDYEQLAKPLLYEPVIPAFGFSPKGVTLLVNHSTLRGPVGLCDLLPDALNDKVLRYASVLGGGSSAWYRCKHFKRYAEYVGDPKAVFGNDTEVGYYAFLQYQCRQVSNGVLCDYSVDPPLAVDAEGRYLNKHSLSEQVRYIYVTSLTTTSVEYAVTAMLAVAFVTIFGTLAGLGGRQVVREGMRYVKAFIFGKLHGHVVGTPGI